MQTLEQTTARHSVKRKSTRTRMEASRKDSCATGSEKRSKCSPGQTHELYASPVAIIRPRRQKYAPAWLWPTVVKESGSPSSPVRVRAAWAATGTDGRGSMRKNHNGRHGGPQGPRLSPLFFLRSPKCHRQAFSPYATRPAAELARYFCSFAVHTQRLESAERLPAIYVIALLSPRKQISEIRSNVQRQQKIYWCAFLEFESVNWGV